LVEETIDVAVKNITFVETIEGRNSHHVLPAVARIYSRLSSWASLWCAFILTELESS
jgi:hypothetical protein